VHLYVAPPQPQKPTTGIIISNKKISHIITVAVRTTSNASTNTDNIICLMHTVNCFKTYFFQTENQISIVIHCSNKQLTAAVRNHNPNPSSPNQCLLKDWDKLNDLHCFTTSFKSVLVVDDSVHLIGIHHH
jgi:hypothetical protein